MRRSDMDERTEELPGHRRPDETSAEGDGRTESERRGAESAPHRASREPAAPGVEVEEIHLLELGNILLKRWKFVFGFPIAAAVLAAIIALIVPPKFTAHAVFVPEQETAGLDLPAGIAGLAAQFGVPIPGGGTSSPEFYAEVVASRTVRDQVLAARYLDPRSEAPGDSATLLDILEVKGRSDLERLEEGREELEKMVSVDVETETDVIELGVQTRYPTLSAAVANAFLDFINTFNLETRQSNARANRRFMEGRIEQAETELREAEERLKAFLERNRSFQNSPDLSFQHDRLQRQVRMKEEVVTTLRRSYEEARIQEVKDTPVITVIDRAVIPQEKSSPRRVLIVTLTLLLGGVLAISFAFGQEFMDRARRRDEEEFDELTSRWRAVKSELRSLLPRRRRDRS